MPRGRFPPARIPISLRLPSLPPVVVSALLFPRPSCRALPAFITETFQPLIVRQCKRGHVVSIGRPLSERIVAELGEGFHPKMAPSELTVKMVSRLTQMLKDVKRFKPPDGACLSPAGEYNLRYSALKNP